jgi:NAD(P)-dependent dehydrogenase (short-subunit alcohol dehydrogenase family)
VTRTYVITGSATGIGSALHEIVRARGGRTIGVDLYGADVVADLGHPSGRRRAIEAIGDLADGTIDAVVACAGLSAAGASAQTAARARHDDPRAIIAVNYFGAVATLEGLRPLLTRAPHPRAAVIASAGLLAADDPQLVALCLDGEEGQALARAALRRGQDAYHASKRAIARWVRRTAPGPDWAGAGIALNAVAPGLTDTPQAHGIVADAGRRARTLERWPMPLGGPGSPEHVAALLAFLTSPENARVTGQVIFVDGGAEAVLRGEDIW